MEVQIVYQSVTSPNRYYYTHKDCWNEQGAGEPCTLLAFRKDEFGWPCVWEEPLAVGGFVRREATQAEKKELLSRAMEAFREEYDPNFVSEAEQYRRELWRSIWDEFTPCPRSLITM